MSIDRFNDDNGYAGTNPADHDKYYYCFAGTDELPHPEDIAAENEYELVGLYLRVYTKLCQINKAITDNTSDNLDQNRRLGKLAEAHEAPLERWVEMARDYLPEWVDETLLGYYE